MPLLISSLLPLGRGPPNEYLREFEAKMGTARLVLQGTHAEPVYAKTSETGSLPCPFNGMDIEAKRSEAKDSIMMFSSISKQSEHVR